MSHRVLLHMRQGSLYTLASFYGSRSKDGEESTSNEDGEKEDVYQFGVILLQIITGKVMAAASSELGSLKLQLENGLREEPSVLRSLADPSVRGMYAYESLRTTVESEEEAIDIGCCVEHPSKGLCPGRLGFGNNTVEEIYKVASIALSPNVSTQIFMGLMVSPPKPRDISYDQFVRERIKISQKLYLNSKGILESLRRRARIMTDGFNSCKNVVCNFTEGAMYSFPQIKSCSSKMSHRVLLHMRQGSLYTLASFYGSRSKDGEESTSNEDGEKEDVYQFGVILLQIITGKVMAAASSELGSLKLQLENGLREEPSVLRSLADPSVRGMYAYESLRTTVESEEEAIDIGCCVEHPSKGLCPGRLGFGNNTVEEIYKVASIALSPNVSTQIFMGLMVSPPKPRDISYDQFVRERIKISQKLYLNSKGILESLRRRARIMTDGFNSCKNVVCNFTEGAMYSFPQIKSCSSKMSHRVLLHMRQGSLYTLASFYGSRSKDGEESTSNEDGEKEDVYQFGVILLQIITGKVMAAASSELGSLKLQLENGLREEPSVLRSLADPSTVEEIYKVASIALSPNVSAQIFMGLMVSPPKPGDISYDQFVRESKGILESLRRGAGIMTDGFNSCKNVVCNFTEGAMYSFPQIKLPPKAIQAAKQAGKVPDVFYCLKLFEATGISTVPGSGFGQKEGVFHLRLWKVS
ncbi:hypothetical protein HID58_073518 [Brassica napus]|uniref:Protein kinase domain-containing protein n=2 Tax=Brassica TaxID=3705 RepID=A0ABQ7Z7T1_BRANA|nr:hypothetical protein HID58_073518 [Brassica napus]